MRALPIVLVGLASLTACAAVTPAAQSQRSTAPDTRTPQPSSAASADPTVPSGTLEDGCGPGLYWRTSLCVHPPATCGGWDGVTCVRAWVDRGDDEAADGELNAIDALVVDHARRQLVVMAGFVSTDEMDVILGGLPLPPRRPGEAYPLLRWKNGWLRMAPPTRRVP